MRFLVLGLIAGLGLFMSLAAANATTMAITPISSTSPVDLVVVKKSERVLYLYDHGLIVGQYPVALGLNPVGTKRHQGDNKTPIGAYTLDWRNPNSQFHRSLHVTYPNADDQTWASAHHLPVGSMIMIHGQPSYDSRPRTGDWTNGCIAVSNAAIEDIWARVPDGTPIHIYP